MDRAGQGHEGDRQGGADVAGRVERTGGCEGPDHPRDGSGIRMNY